MEPGQLFVVLGRLHGCVCAIPSGDAPRPHHRQVPIVVLGDTGVCPDVRPGYMLWLDKDARVIPVEQTVIAEFEMQGVTG